MKKGEIRYNNEKALLPQLTTSISFSQTLTIA